MKRIDFDGVSGDCFIFCDQRRDCEQYKEEEDTDGKGRRGDGKEKKMGMYGR